MRLLHLETPKNRITIVAEMITKDMLKPIGNEFNYRLNIVRVTRAHIQHL